MYYDLETISKKLNISESEIKIRRDFDELIYSKKTDKYDIDSILQARTLTIGIEKYLNQNEKNELLSLMKDFSKLKFTLVSKLQKGEKFSQSGKDRLHRKITKEINSNFTNSIADSALASASGIVKSTDTWKKKTEKNLEDKIKKYTKLVKDEERKLKKKSSNDIKKIKRKVYNYKKGIRNSENKLAKLQSKSFLPVWFGKQHLSKEKRDLNLYRKARLEYFFAGTAGKLGNSQIRIQFSKDKLSYELKLPNKLIKDIKIPKSHQKTFSLTEFNRQSCRIAYNSKGKLVLHITYSYIKPMKSANTTENKGIIGIDIGPKEIAVCYVKNDGNPALYEHFSTGNFLDKRKEENQREISLIIERIIKKGEELGINKIAIEKLENFKRKNYRNKKLNRMLNKFPTKIFEDLMISKCNRLGVKLIQVNPAYTSVIGIYKYSYRDNLSTKHNAKSKDLSAALVIGRRGLGLREREVVCVRVGNQEISIGLRKLLASPEDVARVNAKIESEKWKDYCLWNLIKKRYSSLETLTAYLNEEKEPLQEPREECENSSKVFICERKDTEGEGRPSLEEEKIYSVE